MHSRMNELAETVNSILDGIKPQEKVVNKTMYVHTSGSNLNVRNSPNGSVVDSLKSGTKVTVTEEKLNWSKIGDNKWVSSTYLSEIDYNNHKQENNFVLGRYKTTSNLNVRKGPGTNYGIKKTYKNGTIFDTYEIKGEWAKTPSGYCNLKYAKLIYKY